MPTDNGLQLDDYQGIHNAWRNPIEAGKNQTIEIAEGEPLRRFSSQHIELVAQGQNLRLERRRDQNNPMTAHQISLRMSPIGASIARFAAIRQLDRVYASDNRRILVQGKVCSRAVVIGHIRKEEVTQVSFAEDDDMV